MMTRSEAEIMNPFYGRVTSSFVTVRAQENPERYQNTIDCRHH